MHPAIYQTCLQAHPVQAMAALVVKDRDQTEFGMAHNQGSFPARCS
jgi:hypothetical protein